MPFEFVLVDRQGRAADVSSNGELIISPASANVTKHWDMVLPDVAYNFAPPITGKRMRLQNILMYANKTVGNTDAKIEIYTAGSADSTTVIEAVLTLELPKYASRDMIGLNIELSEGIFLNAKTDDATVFLTMMGYYLDVGHRT